MDKERIVYLHEKFVDETISIEEALEWREIIDNPIYEQLILSLIENSWKNIPDELLSDMPENHSIRIIDQILSQPQAQSKSRKLWISISIAAAVLVAVVSTTILIYSQNETDRTQLAIRHDIAPGKFGGTLTLADGRKIKLSNALNGKLVNETGLIISKADDGQLIYTIVDNEIAKNEINTLTTAPGETYKIVLPDNSSVWLNASSSLTYHTKISSNGNRLVKLIGEGYFEVAKDNRHPFIVESNNQKVEVLGTHFNINSYGNEPSAKTTLLEGSVKIKSNDGLLAILKPGEQATISSKQLHVDQADVMMATAWKNNKFMFESAPVQEVMRMIERWYNVEVIYEGIVPENKFGGSVSRFENVSKVLQILESTEKIHFRIQGRRIYVTK